ncbi:MAG: DUF2442 domain-containing protein [Lentisphaerota bacterium]
MNPHVKSVKPLDNFKLELLFENGEYRIFNAEEYLNLPVFRKLKNQYLFKRAKVVSGSIEWPGEVDLSYDTVYIDSKPL